MNFTSNTLYPSATVVDIKELFPRDIISQIIEDLIPSPHILNEIFPEVSQPGLQAEYIIKSGGRAMAPIVHINSASVSIQPNDTFKLVVDPMIMKANIPITASDMIKLAQPGNPQMMALKSMQAEYANDIKSAIEARTFWAISRILTTGMIFYIGGNPNPVRIYISFDLLPTHLRSVANGYIANAWGTTDATPFEDIEKSCGLIEDDGGAPATHVFMNRVTMALAVTSSTFRAQLIATTPNITDFDLTSRFKKMLMGLDIEPVIINESYQIGSTNYKYIEDYRVAVASITGNNPGDPKERIGEVLLKSSVEAGLSGNEFKTGPWSNTIVTEDPVSAKIVGGETKLPALRYPDRLVCMYVVDGDPGWSAPSTT